MPGCDEGYEIIEGDGFQTQVRSLLSSIERWDEIRRGLDWALNRNPTDPSFTTHLAGRSWFTHIAGTRELFIIYDVDEENCAVVYTNVSLLD